MRAGARHPGGPGPTDELAQKLADPGFTPGAKHVAGLFAVLGGADDEAAERAERALTRMGAALLPHAGKLLAATASPAPAAARARLLRALGRAAPEAGVDLLVRALADDDERVRRAAARALGKIRDRDLAASVVEPALIEAWRTTQTESDKRAIATALGHVGGERALATLGADDAAARDAGAGLAVSRRLERERAPGRVAYEASAEAPSPIVFHVRTGLEALLVEEIAARLGAAWSARVAGAGLVRATLPAGVPLAKAWEPRLALGVAFEVEPRGLADAADPAAAIADALLAADVTRVLSTWTRDGKPRFRLSLEDAGKRRALVRRVAERVAAARTDLVNDPVSATWQVRVGAARDRLELAPRPPDPDPRFAWRVRDVPAASHPTLAAALVRAASPRDGEVVWDPFVGSGAELVEVARACSPRTLFGTDLDERALDAARANLGAAGVDAVLARADATTWTPPAGARVDLIVTNPPMGRRVHRRADLRDVLGAFLEHAAANVLGANGRIVWLSPHRAAPPSGLVVERAFDVDMGGYTATLQILRRRVHVSRRG